MGIFAKIISTSRPIKEIKAQVEGNTKNIAYVMAEIDGIKKMLWPGEILNLTGSAKYEQDMVWPAGIYKIDVQAGGFDSNTSGASRAGGHVVQTITVATPFIIRAYCGSKTKVSTSTLGTNPYSGAFKVNGYSASGTPSAVTHIFGNAGSASHLGAQLFGSSSGNCLGNGAGGNNGGIQNGSAAGSCLHIMPVGGTFGTDYLFAFHATGGALKASGSAYGGAASGSATKFASTSATSSAGGSTPYGNGGAGVTNSTGKNGTGVGAGRADGTGVAAWFDGANWQNSSNTGTVGADGHIIIKYVGPIE